MTFQVSEATNSTEFAEVIKAEHEAYEEPFNTFWKVMKGPNIDECTERQWIWHKSMPNSRWLKVEDKDTGKVIGGAEWMVHETNPFETPQPALPAYWWPEGPMKIASNHILQAFFEGRPSVMNRPHLPLQYRRKGAGSLTVDWGCKLADKMGLEAFVESTDTGKKLYEAHDFVAVRPFFLDFPPIPDGQDTTEWNQLKKTVAPEPARTWLMWRPKGGKFEAGKTVYSWEE
ncbi:hypothetical protein CJF30_00004173 [Rutstroemia sp. NJR-2017a BBW]|nr:hypothetical protein CJF30_00004173 [Rutstroemia sp. NJR-2017a BBW]